MTRIAVFPGQGAQAIGMGRALCDAFPAARAVLDEVDDALGEPLSALIFEGPLDRLTLTANAQPALMATSIAAVRALETVLGRRLPELVGFVAGLCRRVHRARRRRRYRALRRGTPASAAWDRHAGGGCTRRRGDGCDPRCRPADGRGRPAAAAEGGVRAANDNGEGQQVISGDRAAVDAPPLGQDEQRGGASCCRSPPRSTAR